MSTTGAHPDRSPERHELRGRLLAELAALVPDGEREPEPLLVERALERWLAEAAPPAGPVAAALAADLADALMEAVAAEVEDAITDPTHAERQRLRDRLAELRAERDARRADPEALCHQSRRALLRRALGPRR